VQSENEYILTHALDRDLLYYNVREAYLRNRIDYNPLSDALPARDRATADGSIVSQPRERIAPEVADIEGADVAEVTVP
jgi:hypothetical protein